jgi:hypothetical protein
MSWKNWPYWLKGASIFIILFFIIYALTFIKNPGIFEIIIIYLSIPMQLFWSAPSTSFEPLANFVAGISTYVLVGALVGGIYGKKKENKK